ncbi:MAG: serine hydrolase domain-containing protein, partial [Pseudomonadota bacterium]
MVETHGHCADKFSGVKAAFENNFIHQDEIGASVAITYEGEFVVDLWAGHLSRDKAQTWNEDTITNVWSSTKTMAAMCLLVLADRGEVDL